MLTPAGDRPRAFRAFGGATAGLLVPLLACERRMRRTGGPGIIPFELAGTQEHARRITGTWGAGGRSAARLSLALDFPFLVSYTGLNLVASGAASDALRRRGAARLADAGEAVAVAQLAAGACDACENTALLGVLAGHDERLPAVARAFARAKFALLRLGWAYGALGLAAHQAERRARARSPWRRLARRLPGR
jgi:hypothetical protein